MKNKKPLSLILLYVFLLTVIPINLIVDKVNAAEVKTSIPKYLSYSPLYTRLAVQYKDKTVLITGDSNINVGYNMSLKLSQIENGKEKNLYKPAKGDNSLWKYIYMGAFSNKLYIMGNKDSKIASVYTIDPNKANLIYSNTAVKYIPSKENANRTGYFYDYTSALITNNGSQWFAGAYSGFTRDYWNTSWGSENFAISNKGYSTGKKSDEEDTFNLTQDNKGNVYGLNTKRSEYNNGVYIMPKTELIKYDRDTTGKAVVKRYPLSGLVKDIKFDKNGDLYVLSFDTNINKNILTKYNIKNSKDWIVLSKTIPLTNNLTGMNIDNSGNVWILDNGKVCKLVNDKLEEKYEVSNYMNNISVYDDKHLVVYGHLGYTIISIGKVVDPNQPTDPKQVNVDGKVEQKDKATAVVTINSSKVNKNSENILTPKVAVGTNSVEVKIDALTVKGGTGSLTIKLAIGDLNVPFSTINFTGTSAGDYISIKQRISAGDSIVKNYKGIQKVFQYDMTIFDKGNKKKQDIHQFNKGNGKITVKLSDQDLKGIDVTKLAAFYYNETSKSWTKVGGSFDKVNKTFTFQVSHFSKVALMEVDSKTNLPKKK